MYPWKSRESLDEGDTLLSKPSDIDLISALVRYETGVTGEDVREARVDRQELKGGYVSKTLERIDLAITESQGTHLTKSFVQKTCLESEVCSLAAIRAVPRAEATPDIVIAWKSPERPLDQQANGFVSPLYPGGPLTFEDPIPEPVIVTLARVHAYWRRILHQLDLDLRSRPLSAPA